MSDAVAMWSAALLALLFAALRLAVLMRAAINVPAATAFVVKLAAAGNLDRARKLCRAAPRSPYFTALAAALAGDGDSREIRRARFDDAFARALSPIERRGWMDLVPLLGAAVAILIAGTSPDPSLPVVGLSAGAGLVALHNRRAMRRLRREPLIAVPSVLDAVAAPPRAASARAAPAPTVPMPPAGPELPPAEDGGPGVLHLTASLDGEVIAALALEREVVKIGKLASSHLCLDHPSVSRMHAVIETTVEGSTIIDLGSTSGVSINGERINKATIADGDEIRVGEVLVRVSSGPGAPVVSKPAPPPGPPAGAILDLRNGTCPLCRARTIARRPAVAGDLIPWVCEGCGYAQLFTAG